MIRRLGLLTAFLVVPSLAACGSASTVGTSTGGVLTTNYPDALPVQEQLIVGTMKLDGTDNAVDAAEAEQLLPLWLTLQSLNGSDTAATEEITAAVNQIQDTMTVDQLNAIKEMKLTRQDETAFFQAQGFGGRQSSTGTGTPQAPQAFFFGGNDSGGAFPPGGAASGPAGGGNAPGGGGFVIEGSGPGGDGGGFGGTGISTEQRSTLQAQRTQMAASGKISPYLVNIVIRYLESKNPTTPTETPPAP